MLVAADKTRFKPKILLLVDQNADLPVHASLTVDSKTFLRNVARQEEERAGSDLVEVIARYELADSDRILDFSQGEKLQERGDIGYVHCGKERVVEINLSSDSTFFQLLGYELIGLSDLQKQEESKLSTEILDLEQEIRKAAEAPKASTRSDLSTWRDTFDLHTNIGVFFVKTEQATSIRNPAVAQDRLASYIKTIDKQEFQRKFKDKRSRSLLQKLLTLNVILLRNLKFQDLNATAMAKILKS